MKRTPLVLAGLGVTALALASCAPADERPAASSPPVIEHVHGIAADPLGDDVLIATHNGIFAVSDDGTLAGPRGGYDFDAMGFTVAGDVLFASGHPGPQTPAELGENNLGIIRSDDAGETWTPAAFTGVEDFHVLTAGPDGTLYGIGSSSPELLTSEDGEDWERGQPLAAVDLAVTEAGIHAATETGVQVSADGGVSFRPIAEAPVLYSIDARPDGTLVGVGTDGGLWSSAVDGAWTQLDTVTGPVQALSAVDGERIVLVDDRGVVEVSADGATVLVPIVRG